MTEARIWQIAGALGVVMSAILLRAAIVDFNNVAESPMATYADGLWAHARGVLAWFLFIIAASALIAAHVMRVVSGAPHRMLVWLLGAAASGAIGVLLIVWKGGDVAARLDEMPPFWISNGFSELVAGCFLCVLAALLVLGDRMAGHAAKSSRPTTSGPEA